MLLLAKFAFKDLLMLQRCLETFAKDFIMVYVWSILFMINLLVQPVSLFEELSFELSCEQPILILIVGQPF